MGEVETEIEEGDNANKVKKENKDNKNSSFLLHRKNPDEQNF